MPKCKTADSVHATKHSQRFTEFEKNYLLDPVTNELEELPVPKNVQEYVQSFVECALERALERFLPSTETEESDTFADYTQHVEDLASLGEAMEVAESYREQFGLSDKMSMSDIYAFVDKQAQELKAKLSEKDEKKQTKAEEEKKDE